MQHRIQQSKKNSSFLDSAKIRQAIEKKKDILIETEKNIIPYPAYFFRNKKNKIKREGLLVTWSETRIIDLIKQANTNNDRTFTFIGGKTSPRKEAGALNFPSKAVCGTNTRIIDHIRRENLSLEDVDTLIIEIPDKDNESLEPFFADIEFIISKIPSKPNIIAISSNIEKAENQLKKLSLHPQIINLSMWKKSRTENIIIETEDKKQDKSFIVSSLILAYGLKKTICYAEENLVEKIAKELTRLGIATGTILKNDVKSKIEKNVQKFSSLEIEILIIEEGQDFPPIYTTQAIIFTSPPSIKNYNQAINCLSPRTPSTFVFILSNYITDNNIEELKKKVVTDMKKENIPNIEQVISGFLGRLKEHIKEEDTEELEKYKKLFKKNIPLNMRSYVSGFMLKTILQTKDIKITPMQDIFIGAGKNRKIFPGDIKNLLISLEGVKESDIGNIRIMDNYSFAEVNETIIDKVVESLNGIEFKGKKLTVNYGKKKL
ncbi:DEAD/DEAH box helicase [Spirochaetia bacterium 38H-sp]|uniref:DEAD/DEAH box helicase n=1 Tax=Rarispira pelagica TaxID=3141764 RepID=A0ABU9UCI5_9SPIR